MSVEHYQVALTVQPEPGGGASLVPPVPLRDKAYQFVAVAEGGREAIIRVDLPEQDQRKIARSGGCKRLSAEDVEQLRQSYPAPRLKRLYRSRGAREAVAGAAGGRGLAVDDAGRPIVDTYQTVRAGYYLIDVPVAS